MKKDYRHIRTYTRAELRRIVFRNSGIELKIVK